MNSQLHQSKCSIPSAAHSGISEEDTVIESPVTITGLDIEYALYKQLQEERQVIVHIYSDIFSRIRIWPTTFLICLQTGIRSKLIHSENIGRFPNWSFIRPNESFTLVFEGLPDACSQFDLVEEIPEPGAFVVRGIGRNELDVYKLWM